MTSVDGPRARSPRVSRHVADFKPPYSKPTFRPPYSLKGAVQGGHRKFSFGGSVEPIACAAARH
jgi:hypothetical protein